jgi:hypothetical protein
MLKRIRSALSERRLRRSAARLEQFRDRTLGVCPYCGAGLGTHPSLDVASSRPWVVGSRAVELEQYIAQHDWRAASLIHEFVGTEDAIVFHAVRCPVTAESIIFKLASKAEMWEDDSVISRDLLSAEDTAALEAALPDSRWYTSAQTVARINRKR